VLLRRGSPFASSGLLEAGGLFEDTPGSTFYSYVHCLACRGIINGYPGGIFKPNNQVTRGQLSKIVSNSTGFSDPQPNQMFEDVLLESTFQVCVGLALPRFSCSASLLVVSPGKVGIGRRVDFRGLYVWRHIGRIDMLPRGYLRSYKLRRLVLHEIRSRYHQK
jgi:hypothetical protein